MAQVLLSVPPALSQDFAVLTRRPEPDWFATHDPVDQKLGSGGGTAHLVHAAWQKLGGDTSFAEWAQQEKRIIVHSGGQSRRLPAYAPGGKALVPVPVFRWARGQRIDQSLIDLQLPLLERIQVAAPDGLRWLIASGDVLVWNDAPIQPLPDVDVLCVGLWDSPEKASNHGCFFAPRDRPHELAFMRQKPRPEEVHALTKDYFFLLDIGIWILSDRAMRVLMNKSGYGDQADPQQPTSPQSYDLYGQFGLALGSSPTMPDPEVSKLSCALVDLDQGEFYHFGTNREILQSSLALQNRVINQREIRSSLPKPHPSIFIQNALTQCALTSDNQEVWIDNAHMGAAWSLQSQHVLTGIPENNWECGLPTGACLDFVPIGTDQDTYAVRFYGFDDTFAKTPLAETRGWGGDGAIRWFTERGLEPGVLGIDLSNDIQTQPIFPVLERDVINGDFLTWLFVASHACPEGVSLYTQAGRLSAEELGAQAELSRAFSQRQKLMDETIPLLAKHANRSVFYQLDLKHAAEAFARTETPLPENSPAADEALIPFLHDRVFRAQVTSCRGGDSAGFEREAFEALRRAVIEPYRGHGNIPQNTLLSDQVVWGRAPIRLDLAGGWSDTPPYCLLQGGNVVNVAANLNGQPPIQVFGRVCTEPVIRVHSIDLGQSTCFKSFDDLAGDEGVHSPFSIPRAALALAGFHPDFLTRPKFSTLADQLQEFGGGIELSLLCAVPKGSGLGTSSILASAVLGVISELGGLKWSSSDVCARVLAIEQMLTSGGGWQDQFGGVLRGVKLLQTQPGLSQNPTVRWLPSQFFTDPSHRSRTLLYYTGITRVARGILSEIVRGMFLNDNAVLQTLDLISQHAESTASALQTDCFDSVAQCVGRSWELNQTLDSGTNPPEVAAIVARIGDWVSGLKLLGAGGGGFLLIMAKDADSALRIRRDLESSPPNPGARFVDMTLSNDGLIITRS